MKENLGRVKKNNSRLKAHINKRKIDMLKICLVSDVLLLRLHVNS